MSAEPSESRTPKARLLHLSDIHFGRPHRPRASAALLALVESRRPDLVVISGDLTQRAKPREFRQAREFVAGISVPWIAVPGNHDVPMYRFWERLLAPYGAYRSHFAQDLEPVHEGEGLFVVGVNSAHGLTIDEGRVRRSRLRRLAEQLRAAPASATKVVVVHHLLIPAPLFAKSKRMFRAAEMIEVLVEGRVDLVLSGHYHQSFFGTSEEHYPSGRKAVPLLYAGTGSSSRGRGAERGACACHWIEIGGGELDFEVLRWEPGDERFRPHSRHHLGLGAGPERVAG